MDHALRYNSGNMGFALSWDVDLPCDFELYTNKQEFSHFTAVFLESQSFLSYLIVHCLVKVKYRGFLCSQLRVFPTWYRCVR